MFWVHYAYDIIMFVQCVFIGFYLEILGNAPLSLTTIKAKQFGEQVQCM